MAHHINIPETYQADARANGRRKRIDDIDSRNQPRRQFVTATLRWTRPKYLRSKHGDDGIWRIASLKVAE